MSPRCLGLALAVAILAIVSIAPVASSQTLPYNYTLAVTDVGGAAPCNGPVGCEGAVARDDLGTYVFSVRVLAEVWYQSIDRARFELGWPDEWIVTNTAVCQGAELVSGDPTMPGSVVELAFPACIASAEYEPVGPVLELTIDCTVPGRFELLDEDQMPSVRLCEGGEWGNAGDWWSSWNSTHVEIGDFCGRAVHPPCDICLQSFEPSGRFLTDPIDLILSAGTVARRHVTIRQTACGASTYCGGPQYSGWCVEPDWVEGSEPWIQVAHAGTDGFDEHFDVTISAETLAPGTYAARIEVPRGCPVCLDNCQPVTVTVDPAIPVELHSWGEIKARY